MPASPLFASWLKQRRAELGLTQAQLAAAVGCSLSLVRKYELGARQPTRAIALRLGGALGLEPAEEARFLELALGPQAPLPRDGIAMPVQGWLPAAPPPLLGREALLAWLGAELLRTPGRCVTLVGPPGVGKTRVAVAAAAATRQGFADGAWFVDLAAIAASDDVAAAIAVRLGAPSVADDERELARYLEPRRLLLVLDNFEHLLAAAPLVARLLAAAPRLTVLATSRVPLRIRAEQRVPIEPLPLPRTVSVGAVASTTVCWRRGATARRRAWPSASWFASTASPTAWHEGLRSSSATASASWPKSRPTLCASASPR